MEKYNMRELPPIKDLVYLPLEDTDPLWVNRPPMYKGSSTKEGKSTKRIQKERKKKKMNRRKSKRR